MTQESIIKIIIIILICLLLCYLTKKIVKKIFVINTNKIPEKRKKTISNLISNIIIAFIIVICGSIILEEFGIDTKSFIASLGVLSLVVGLALQDLLKDIIAGISIVLEGQFNIGDYIKIGDFKGEVISTNLRTTKIKAYTGEIKIISNRNIVELINYTMGESLYIIDVDVAYESDLDKVQNVLNVLCEGLKKEKGIKHIECLGLDAFDSSSLKYRVILKSTYSDSFALARKVRKQIVEEFRRNDINIPFQQVVIHDARL